MSSEAKCILENEYIARARERFIDLCARRYAENTTFNEMVKAAKDLTRLLDKEQR